MRFSFKMLFQMIAGTFKPSPGVVHIILNCYKDYEYFLTRVYRKFVSREFVYPC